MHKLETESHLTLVEKTKDLVQSERKTTREILERIAEVDRRGLFAELGYPSLFEWVVRDLGYSHSAAYRRVQSARQLKSVPEVGEKIESGAVNLTTLALLQTAIRKEERRTKTPVPVETKAQLVEKIESKSAHQVEVEIARAFPELPVVEERLKPISDDRFQLSVSLTVEEHKLLMQVRSMASHAQYNPTWSDTIVMLAKDYVRRKTPAARRAAAAKTQRGKLLANPEAKLRQSRAELFRQIKNRDRGRCTYIDPRTGHVCGSQYQVQIDHIFPRAMGGEDTVDNLRCLCRTHNLLLARRTFGSRLVDRKRT